MSTATLTDMDQELRDLLNEENQANKYLHYINKDVRDRMLLNGGGRMRTICGKPITVNFQDGTFAAGKYATRPICPDCNHIYGGLRPGD